MLITSDFLSALYTNQKAIFQKALGEALLANQDYAKISSRMDSASDQETYNWLGATPAMSEWKDKRKLNGLRPYSYTLKNVHYEGTVEIDRDTIEDDKLGMIRPRVQALAVSAIKHFNKMAFSLLDDAHTGKAYDGTIMTSDTRTIGASANIDNYLSGNYSDSEAEIRTAVQEAVAAMALYQDDWGQPMGLVPDTLVCAPGFVAAVRQALTPGVAGTVRPEAEYIKQIVVSPWIDNAVKDWFLICTTEMVKPVIFQMRKEPEFVALDDPKSDHVFKNKSFLYGVDDRFAVGYGDPRTIVQLHNT
jgi:phage major head subunit gpT-like protein